MLFNSLDFLIFLPVVLLIYYVLSSRAQNVWLLIASYVFYGWWDWRFLGLILISTIVDFWVGRQIASTREAKTRKRFLTVSILTNLGILVSFAVVTAFVADVLLAPALLELFDADADHRPQGLERE